MEQGIAICTISSQSHLYKTQALWATLQGKTTAEFHCLVTDVSKVDPAPGCTFHYLSELTSDEADKIKKKYTGNRLRWALKPVFMMYLLEQGYDSVIYTDNDIGFVASPDFLFEKLTATALLLTPHYYPADPQKDQNWLEANYRVGLYNGGFVGANKTAIPALKWWAECCIYNVKKSYRRGLFDDQKYLDMVPVLFNGVEVLAHKGCNVAGWNLVSSPRSKNAAGELLLDNLWPLVFIHYNYYTIQCILRGKDPLLLPYWNTYHDLLRQYNPAYQVNKDIRSASRDLRQYFDYIRYRLARLAE